MDMIGIGKFLAELRKELGLTQEQLGEKIGVTNKTISRWETGTYLPPVEMLLELSKLYDVSINELLSGKRLNEDEYKVEAERNLIEVSKNSAFSLKDKIEFFTKKWKKEHLFGIVLGCIIVAALIICGIIYDNGLLIVGILGGFAWYLIQRNRMMAFVEKYAYDGSDNKNQKE